MPAPAARFRCPDWPPPVPQLAGDLAALLASGDWGRYDSPVLQRLRGQIRDSLGIEHVRLTCSGSAAIELALRACGVAAPTSGPPPEVICPALDYPGNLRAVRILGALPVLVDTLPGRWTIDPEAVLAAATSRTVAVVASHLYGDVARVDALRELCDRRGWRLIEDVCQMPGGTLSGRPLGSFGHVAVWSFGGSKPLTAGCGGALVTADDRIAQRLAAHLDRPSNAFPLSSLQAAVLLPQWETLAELGQRQRSRLARLVADCGERTPNWRWPRCDWLADEAAGLPVYYKVPIVLRSPAEGAATVGLEVPAADSPGLSADALLAAAVQLASDYGIPSGKGFHIPERISRSRGRVESANNARELMASTWLIDHRALAGGPATGDALARGLIEVHARWSELVGF